MSYEAERAIAKAAQHGFAYRGFGYAAHITTFNPEFCLGLLDKLERYEAALDDIMNIHDYQDRGNESYWLAKRALALNPTEANDGQE